jgi:hypothetical protein
MFLLVKMFGSATFMSTTNLTGTNPMVVSHAKKEDLRCVQSEMIFVVRLH